MSDSDLGGLVSSRLGFKDFNKGRIRFLSFHVSREVQGRTVPAGQSDPWFQAAAHRSQAALHERLHHWPRGLGFGARGRGLLAVMV